MHKKFLMASVIVITLVLISSNSARAQSDTPKAEIGAQFSLLNIERVSGRVIDPGFGGRFTYNATKSIGVEAEVNFFPKEHNGSSNQDGGRITQGLFGVKVGKRFQKVGIFGKARPGFVSFDRAILNRDSRVTIFQFGRLTHLAFDLGGVLEVYPSRRAVVRFDLGDTVVRYGAQNFIDGLGRPSVNEAFTRHNLQFSAGAGFRF